MVLYTCFGGASDLPGPLSGHPCAKAMKALSAAGIDYEHRKVGGIRALPWTTKSSSRDLVRELTGQSLVPCLVFDDGTAIAGSDEIAAWAGEHAVTAS
ncbi:MAG: glutathione S-transferase domain-containing protein [Solirubrobacteraceae bacterium]|nr:glutathione S-transferase domain-containing protein [Solirubrobacteraceae bacterium]